MCSQYFKIWMTGKNMYNFSRLFPNQNKLYRLNFYNFWISLNESLTKLSYSKFDYIFFRLLGQVPRFIMYHPYMKGFQESKNQLVDANVLKCGVLRQVWKVNISKRIKPFTISSLLKFKLLTSHRTNSLNAQFC
jgi:hypothetical protein